METANTRPQNSFDRLRNHGQLVVIALTLAVCCPRVQGDDADVTQAAEGQTDWKLPRGDIGFSGSSDVELASELKVLWEFKADEAIETIPCVTEKLVIVGDVFGKLYAVERNSGSEVWRKDYDTGFVAPPAVNGDMLVIGDVEGNVYAINVADGKELWKKKTAGEIGGAANFHGDNVLIASQDGKLYYYSSGGKEEWTYATNDQVRCSPSIAGDYTFLGGCDSQLHRIDLRTGKAAGKPLPLRGPTGSTPAVSGGSGFLTVMSGDVIRFDWKKHKQEWVYADPNREQEYRASAAAKGDLVIVSSQYKQIDAISIKTGNHVWRHTLRRRADASPVIAGPDVWIASTDGRLIRLDVETGKVKWTFEIKGAFIAAPAVTKNQLFIADDEGVLRCFGIKKDS